jgi:hypothetical protein
MVSWREREARTEARSRDRNEWIEAASDSFGAHAPTETFVCECGDPDCARTIELSRAEYEAVRSTSNRFAIAPDHENPEMEVVVSEGSRFAVVDKIHGWGLRIARASDPRSNLDRRLKP